MIVSVRVIVLPQFFSEGSAGLEEKAHRCKDFGRPRLVHLQGKQRECGSVRYSDYLLIQRSVIVSPPGRLLASQT